jgi:hypothetical protein
MKRLTKDLKRALSALANAEAGEMLPRRTKHQILSGNASPALASDADNTPSARVTRRRQIAFWHAGAVTRDRKSTRLNSSHNPASRMPSSA